MSRFVSSDAFIEHINAFCLGAVMQQDPFLEQFGELPDEPPDDDPCWYAAPDYDYGVKKQVDYAYGVKEQPDLFQEEKPPQPRSSSVLTRGESPRVRPYEPRYIPYADWLRMFCGNEALARHYHDNQKCDPP